MLEDPLSARLAHLAPPRGIGDEVGNGVCEGSAVLGRHEEPGFSSDHHVPVSRNVGRDDGQTRRHGLERRQRQPFLERRRHVEVEEAIDADRVAEESREDDAVLEARLGDQAPDASLLAAAADEEQRQSWQATREPAHRLQQDLEALDRIPAAHAAEDEVVRLKAQRLAADGSTRGSCDPSPRYRCR